jgi:hypothetical protein
VEGEVTPSLHQVHSVLAIPEVEDNKRDWVEKSRIFKTGSKK